MGSGVFGWSLLMARWLDPKAYMHYFLYMRGVLHVPSSSPTLPPIYDGLDVSLTSNITWFHLNHDMVSRRIHKLSFYGGHFRYSVDYFIT